MERPTFTSATGGTDASLALEGKYQLWIGSHTG